MYLVCVIAKPPRTKVLTDMSVNYEFWLPEWISIKVMLKIPYFWSAGTEEGLTKNILHTT